MTSTNPAAGPHTIPASFTNPGSIVREIWSKGDTVLFIFAGAAAEFALNKAVDWLYFTGKLPADPLRRLFSTVAYAHRIIFSTDQEADTAIHQINHIHQSVEQKRGTGIPDWAYRDVLFQLIYYSIHAFEALERKLSREEKEEVIRVFCKVGCMMQIPSLPQTYDAWLQDHKQHLRDNLERSHFTDHLFNQYKAHLGWLRYKLLLGVQALLAPPEVKNLRSFKSNCLTVLLLGIYKKIRHTIPGRKIRYLLLPHQYRSQIMALDLIHNPL